MKKHWRKILLALLLLLLIGSFTLQDPAARLYIRLNTASLEAFAQEALSDGAAQTAQYGPWRVSVWHGAGIVEFHIRQSPASGGVEKGFYYSAAGTPASFQATGYPLRVSGGGWIWEDPYGNHGYTERIQANWFWYDAVI